MFSSLNRVGINITRNKMQLVEVVREASKFCLENVDEHISEVELNLNSTSVLQASLNSLTHHIALRSKNISISIPTNKFVIFEIPFEPSLSPEALNEHINWEFTILFPMLKSDEYVIRTIPLENSNTQKNLLAIALSTKIIKTLYAFAKQNDFILRSIDTAHFAFDSLINKTKNSNFISAYYDSDYCSINSYIDNKLNTTKQFEISEPKSVIELVRMFIEDENNNYEKIYLASSLEADELRIELTLETKIDVEMSNPFISIPTSEVFIQNAYFINKPNSFAAAAGLCYRTI